MEDVLRVYTIHSNKIEKAHQLSRFLRLGPGTRLALALGVASRLTRLQRLWRSWTHPGGIHERHLDLQARAGPNEAQLAPAPSQSRQRSDAPLQQPWHELHQQLDRHVERIHALLGGQLHLQAMKQLRQEQGTPDLYLDDLPFGAPQLTELQVLFEHAEGQFDIPAPRVQLSDVGQRELLRIEHIGQVTIQPSVVVKLHQPHWIFRPIGPVAAQPHDGIQDPVALIEEMAHLHAGVIGVATDPPQLALG